MPQVNVQYIGIPFVDKGRDRNGADCWGLFRLAQKELFGRDLPSYSEYDTVENKAHVNALIEANGRFGPDWKEVPAREVIEGDCVLMFRLKEYHVGLVVDAPRHLMLHTEKGPGSLIEDWTRLRFKHHIVGFYRHE